MKWLLVLVVAVGCGSAESTYKREQAKLDAMLHESDDLQATILFEVTSLNNQLRRDLDLYKIKADAGLLKPGENPPLQDMDKFEAAWERSQNSPLQQDLAELHKRIEEQKVRVKEARASFTE